MRHNLNYKMLLRLLCGLLMIESIFMLVPLFTALYWHETDWKAFAWSAGVALILGYLGFYRIRTTTSRFGRRESYLLTASVWVVYSLFGMIPFVLSENSFGLSDAFFEAMSGFTTTGATSHIYKVDPGHGILMWQAMMQWIGGMGIILFTLAIIPALNNTGGMQMFNAEVTGITHDKIRPRISQTAKALWGIYLALTLILALLLWAGPMSAFDAVLHAFGTISTGGFSTHAGGVTAFGSDYVNIVVIVFMLLGGINFALIYQLLRGKWEKIRKNDVLITYLKVILLATSSFIVAIVCFGQCHGWRDLTIDPLFQVVSTITSTGYVVPGFIKWGPFVLAVTFLMMLSGGCAGSTSGGAKIDRLIFMRRYLNNELYHSVRPNAVTSVKVNGKIVDPDVVSRVVAFLCLYVITVVVSGTLLSLLGLPAVDSFFSSFSCISNTGFGASVTGYGDDFASMPDAAKWILSGVMLIGRLEIFTVLAIFTRPFWR